MRRPTRKTINDQMVDNAARDTARERQQAQAAAQFAADLAAGEVPEARQLQETITAHQVAKRVVPDGEEGDGPTPLAQWGNAYPRASQDARINQQSRDIMAAHARSGRGDAAHLEDLIKPEPVWTPVTATHPSAGQMRLATDGDGWVLRIRGAEHGLGNVKASERAFTDDAAPVYVPRPEILEKAASVALTAPGGPEQPIGSVWFTSGPDGEPIEHRVGENLEPQRPDVSRIRDRLARLAHAAGPWND